MNLLRLPTKDDVILSRLSGCMGIPFEWMIVFLLWKLGWANIFDGHWNQQNVPLRGKKTSLVIRPNISSSRSRFSKVLQVFHRTAALQPVAETLGCWLLSLCFKGVDMVCNIKRPIFLPVLLNWEIISSKLMTSKNPLNSWHQKKNVMIHQFVFVRPTASL